jgi:putative membrane-bound dehydrogenase-like protein
MSYCEFIRASFRVSSWSHFMSRMRNYLVVAVVAVCGPLGTAVAQKEYGFDNTKPSGQPYLAPEESVRRLHVPPEYEVKLFAAEPEIVNPIAFTVDERGRLWVVENYSYPNKTPKGQKPKDRIKILEDTTGSGHADKVTVWAEGKDLPISWDLASGIEVGHGGVYFGAAPYLFFLQDTKGTGRCDKQTVLLSGFGDQDEHEVLNTFQWGPDGFLYGLQGIFTHSKVGGVQMDAAVWRYHTRDKVFDIFAEGTSNPWGLDFDQHGQAFLTCCVIPHAFHIIPGGTYIRQAGVSQNPYAYGLLHEISDHLHHSESGWAHAGALVMQGDHVPERFRDHLLMGSIHGCSIKNDILGRRGSTFVAKHGPDFLTSGDRNFRPLNLRWAPDGSIYVIDWHDQNPCHQAARDSWDMTHGRIFKIQLKGTKSRPPGDLSKKSSRELVGLLKNNNPWWYRTALRLLSERRDRSVTPDLLALAVQDRDDRLSLRGLWGLWAVGAFDDTVAERLRTHDSAWVRSWVVRLLGEQGRVSEEMMDRLDSLAAGDRAPEVRLQLASTAHRLYRQGTMRLLHKLMLHKEDAHDPCIPLMIWLAYEPQVVRQPKAVLDWLRDNAGGNTLVTNEIVPRTVRRLTATGRPEDLAACVAFLDELKDNLVRRQSLEALVKALRDRQVEPPADWKTVFAALKRDRDPEVGRLARRLAVNFHDPEAIRAALVVAADAKQPESERLDAVHDLALAHPREGLITLLGLLRPDQPLALRQEACRALAAYADAGVPRRVLAGWKRYPPVLRVEAVNLLAGRKPWAGELLTAVGKGIVPRDDLTNNTILRIRAFGDPKLNEQVEKVWGKVRDTPAELNALIDHMRGALAQGPGSFERGRKVFENQCAKCHTFQGVGHTVGPNLDGAARDIEYLLVNVLDPNRVVGAPYFTRVVTLKNGRVETGLLAAEDDQSLTLKGENDALKRIEKKDIDEVAVQEKSVMPEGLNKNMSEQAFRDLVKYVMANPFITDVAVTGPFGDKVPPKLDRFGVPKGFEWTYPKVGPPGRIPLPAAKGQAECEALVYAEVTAPAAMQTRLLVGTNHPLRVQLNGEVVYDGKPGQRLDPDQAGVDVRLRRGTNRLAFVVTYTGNRAALYARLLDPQRKLKYGEPHER